MVDRFRASRVEESRAIEALEQALERGHGSIAVHPLNDEGEEADTWKYTRGLACADCGISFSHPHPSSFSFNSPLGACDTCHGFGRVIGVDFGSSFRTRGSASRSTA